MFGNLFKQRSHYVFDYKPRYYDERKERLKSLENDAKNSEIKLIKNNLKSRWVRAKKPIADKNVNKRLAIIIAILIGIVAYFFELHKLF